jgi:Enoyl reductase FAD binding domain
MDVVGPPVLAASSVLSDRHRRGRTQRVSGVGSTLPLVAVQDAVATEWRDVAAGHVPAESDARFQSEVRRLQGFDVDGVDYSVAGDV